jgi:hypothetical protein
MVFSFKSPFKIRESAKPGPLKFADPTFRDPIDRHAVDEMPFFPALAHGRDQVRCFEHDEVLGYGLTRHVEALAQLAKRLSILAVKSVQQAPPARVRQGPEDVVVCHARQ